MCVSVPLYLKAPERPERVSFEHGVHPTEVTVTWSKSATSSCQVTSYIISFSIRLRDMCEKSLENNEPISTVAHSPLEKTVNRLHPNSLYNFCIIGVNDAGTGGSTCNSTSTGYSGKET